MGRDLSPNQKVSRRATGIRVRTQKRSEWRMVGGGAWQRGSGGRPITPLKSSQAGSSYLRQVVRVWQFGRHIEPEVFIVINVRVSKANEHSSTTDESLFQKDGFQSWIQDLSKLKH